MLALLSLVSCKKGGMFCWREDGSLVSESRSVSGFDEVALSDIGNVYVEQASDYEVIVEASQNLQEIIVTQVKNNTLDIRIKKGKCVRGNPTINVYVKTPNLRGLSISGSGNIFCNGFVETDKMDLRISGSGDIEVDSLSCQELEASISGSGNINVAGTDTLSYEDLHISGSGNITTLNYPAMHVDASISGSGTCKVHALSTLNADISGSGDVLYLGNPSVTSNSTGSGQIRPY